MAYSAAHVLDDMTWDEFVYEVDCMLIAHTGEAANDYQLRDITTDYARGRTPRQSFGSIVEFLEPIPAD